LWRAIGEAGEVLEAYVTMTRDKAAALKFLRAANHALISNQFNLEHHFKPRQIFEQDRAAALAKWQTRYAN